MRFGMHLTARCTKAPLYAGPSPNINQIPTTIASKAQLQVLGGASSQYPDNVSRIREHLVESGVEDFDR